MMTSCRWAPVGADSLRNVLEASILSQVPDRLVAYLSFDESTDTHVLDFIRDLSQQESDDHAAGIALLTRLSSTSAYRDLHDAAQQVQDARRIAEEAMKKHSPLVDAEVHDLHVKVKVWLSAFRSFDDRTSSWLSREFGENSAQETEFKRMLSLEFDSNFAYRMCAALRNASEHVDRVVNVIKSKSREQPDGRTELLVTIALDGPRLATDFKKLNGSIKRELREVPTLMTLEKVVNAVMDSCTAAFAGLILFLRPQIQAAVTQIRGLDGEARAVGGQYGLIINMHTLAEGRPRIGGKMDTTELGIPLAEVASKNLLNCRAVAVKRRGELRPVDLA